MAPALDFPASPVDGQVYSNWVYSSSKGAWQAKPLTPGQAQPSATAPTSPSNGDQWFNTVDGTLYIYYNDGDTAQWVESRAPITADGYISPNYVLNGSFEINQRNFVDGTNIGADTYTLDRWYFSPYGSGQVVQISTQSDAGVATPFGRYARLRVGTNNLTNIFFSQSFDNTELRAFRGKTMTLSFWYSSSITSSVTAEARYGTYVSEKFIYTGNGSQIASVSCPTSAGWVRKTVTFTVPATAEGFCIMFSVTNVVNNVANVFQVAGVQLEEGSVATPFRRNANSLQGELAACQRYYCKSYNLADAPGTSTLTGCISAGAPNSGASGVYAMTHFKSSMRATPTISIYAPDGTANKLGTALNSTISSYNIDAVGENSFTVENFVTPTDRWFGHFTASAEL